MHDERKTAGSCVAERESAVDDCITDEAGVNAVLHLLRVRRL